MTQDNRPLRVVITGAESTGKSAIAGLLAVHFSAPLVSEQIRLWVERERRLPQDEDVWQIVEQFREARARSESLEVDLVIYDTDLISTVIYHHYYFGHTPRAIQDLSVAEAGDVYFLADDDFPWVADALHRDGEGIRSALQNEFRKGLAGAGIDFTLLSGRIETRLETAIDVISIALSATDQDGTIL